MRARDHRGDQVVLPNQYPAVIVFCKRPHAGSGKQRLAAEIGAADAHLIADALLDCTLEDVADWPGRVIISPAHPADESWAEGLLANADVLVQPDGNLGQRLQQIDRILLRQGCQQRIYIGTDAPLLGPATLLRAAAALREHAVVLQPASDGGVTLMATASAWPRLTDLPWSEKDLGQSLHAACLLAGHSVYLLPACMDVDVLADLRMMQQLLADDPRCARQSLLYTINTILGQEFESKISGKIGG